jgi:hypothetical protein
VWRNDNWLISADVALIKLIHNRAKTVINNYHHSATYTVSQSSPITRVKQPCLNVGLPFASAVAIVVP